MKKPAQKMTQKVTPMRRTALREATKALREMVTAGGVGGFIAGGLSTPKKMGNRDTSKYKPTRKEFGMKDESVGDLLDAVSELCEAVMDEETIKKRFTKVVRNKETGQSKTVHYGQAGNAKDGGDRIRPGTSKGDAYCARSNAIKGDWRSDPNSPNNLSRKKWKCHGSKSLRETTQELRDMIEADGMGVPPQTVPDPNQPDIPSDTNAMPPPPAPAPAQKKTKAKRYSGKEWKADGGVSKGYKPAGKPDASGRGAGGASSTKSGSPPPPEGATVS